MLHAKEPSLLKSQSAEHRSILIHLYIYLLIKVEKEFYLMKPNTKKDDIDSKWSKTLTGLDGVFNSENQSEVHVHNYNMFKWYFF